MPVAVLQRRTARPAVMAFLVLSYLAPWLAIGDDAFRGIDFEGFMAAYQARGTSPAAVPPISWHLVHLAPFAAALVVVLEWRRIALKLADLVYYVVLLVAPFALLMTLIETGQDVRLLVGAAAPIVAAAAGLAAGRLRGPGAE